MQARKLHLSKGVMWLALAILGPIEVHAQTTPDTLWIQLNEVTLAGDTMPALRFCPSMDWDTTVNVSFYVNVGSPMRWWCSMAIQWTMALSWVSQDGRL